MRVILKWRLLLGVFIILGCKKNVDQDSSVFVNWHHCSQKNYRPGIVKICFDSLMQDSRCPMGALCIWQGTAVVRFSLTVNNSSQNITLATLNVPGLYRTDTTLMGYKIALLNVTPFPRIDFPQNVSEYEAELRITPQ